MVHSVGTWTSCRIIYQVENLKRTKTFSITQYEIMIYAIFFKSHFVISTTIHFVDLNPLVNLDLSFLTESCAFLTLSSCK